MAVVLTVIMLKSRWRVFKLKRIYLSTFAIQTLHETAVVSQHPHKHGLIKVLQKNEF